MPFLAGAAPYPPPILTVVPLQSLQRFYGEDTARIGGGYGAVVAAKGWEPCAERPGHFWNSVSSATAGSPGMLLTLRRGLGILRRMERTEAELIAAVLKGDAASFEPLVEKYSPRVFATARRYARRESEVEDIAQDIWLKAFEKLSSFRGEAPFEHWLMRLAVRTCYDSLRRPPAQPGDDLCRADGAGRGLAGPVRQPAGGSERKRRGRAPVGRARAGAAFARAPGWSSPCRRSRSGR